MPKGISQKTHEAQKLRYNARSRVFAYNGWAPWGEQDIEKVLEHAIPDSELCKKIGRSIQAIQAMRNRMAGGVHAITG